MILPRLIEELLLYTRECTEMGNRLGHTEQIINTIICVCDSMASASPRAQCPLLLPFISRLLSTRGLEAHT